MSLSKKVEERLKIVENLLEVLNERMAKLEEKLGIVDKVQGRVDVADSRQLIHETNVHDKLKVMSEENESKMTITEMRIDDKLSIIGNRIDELVNQSAAFEIKLTELNKDWPTPSEALIMADNSKKERELSRTSLPDKNKKPSFSSKYSSKAKDTIVLVGDSLARGVGVKLEQQSHMVTTISMGGAKIEDVSEQISKLEDKEDRHLVVLVGTNNIKNEGSKGIIDKYSKLLEESSKVKNRKISLVGIPRRLDLNNYENSRRIGVNLELENLCRINNTEFISYEPWDSRMARDGLHLNHLGQDELGRAIFGHCRSFLS